MAGIEAVDLQNLNSLAVLKFHQGGILIADDDAEIPDETTLVNPDGTFNLEDAIRSSYRSAGLITTDGITIARSMSADDTKSWQTLAVVRSDVTQDDLSFKLKWQETNKVTRAISDGLTFAQIDQKWTDSGYSHKRDSAGTQPNRRGILFAKDTKYGISMAMIVPNITISDLGDQAVGRATELQYDATVKVMYDPTYQTDAGFALAGPGWARLSGQSITAGSGTQATPVTP